RRPGAGHVGMTISLIPVEGLPEVRPGDVLAELIAGVAALQDGDVVVVTQKVVSKAEGRLEPADPDDPLSHKALVEREAVRVLREASGIPAAIVRGVGPIYLRAGSVADEIARPPNEDLFR